MTLRNIIAAALLITATAARAEPATVYFPSNDGTTQLVGYLFTPTTPGPHPAVVMLHGRSGPYSKNDNEDCTLVAKGTDSDCNASTLSKRHMAWGEYWAAHGYVALLPDSFGPRDKGHGFGRGTHNDPDRDDVNERTVRPFDAEGALKFLQARKDVTPSLVFLQGWSNGGSTTLNVMYRQAQSSLQSSSQGFRAALAFYPGCGPRALISQEYKTSAPITVFLGTNDEEVSPVVCHRVLDPVAAKNTALTVVDYPGATHDFDDPGKKRQSVPGNAAARDDVLKRAAAFFGK
ncbi:MAG: dienelactone hydrolase family protein [Bradyrhizobium sp.]